MTNFQRFLMLVQTRCLTLDRQRSQARADEVLADAMCVPEDAVPADYARAAEAFVNFAYTGRVPASAVWWRNEWFPWWNDDTVHGPHAGTVTSYATRTVTPGASLEPVRYVDGFPIRDSSKLEPPREQCPPAPLQSPDRTAASMPVKQHDPCAWRRELARAGESTKKHVTPEEREFILNLLAQHVKFSEIARLTGLSVSSVYNINNQSEVSEVRRKIESGEIAPVDVKAIFEQAQIARRPDRPAREAKPAARKKNDESRRAMMIHLLAQGVRPSFAAELAGFSKTSVAWLRKRFENEIEQARRALAAGELEPLSTAALADERGISARPVQRRGRGVKSREKYVLTDEQRDEALRLFEDGVMPKDVAKAVDAPPNVLVGLRMVWLRGQVKRGDAPRAPLQPGERLITSFSAGGFEVGTRVERNDPYEKEVQADAACEAQPA